MHLLNDGTWRLGRFFLSSFFISGMLCAALTAGICAPAYPAGEPAGQKQLPSLFEGGAEAGSWEVMQLFAEGRALQRTGRTERADALYRKAFCKDMDRIEILPYWGLSRSQLGFFSDSLLIYDYYLEHEPGEDLVIFNKAVCLAHLGRWDEAEEAVRLCTGSELLPQCAEFWVLRGCLARRRQNWAEAENFFLRAADTDPDNISAVLGRALVLRDSGRNEEAAEILSGYAGKIGVSGRAALVNNLGVLAADSRILPQADKQFSEASEQSGTARLNLSLWRVLYEHDADLLTLAELCDEFPDNALADFLYGVALYRSQRFREAKNSFCESLAKLESGEKDEVKNGHGVLTAAEKSDLEFDIKNYLGLAILALEQPAEAVPYLSECAAGRGSAAEFHNLAVAQFKAGLNNEALTSALQARKLLHDLMLAAENDGSQKIAAERLRWEPVYYQTAYLLDAAGRKCEAAAAYAEWMRFFSKDGKAAAVKLRMRKLR